MPFCMVDASSTTGGNADAIDYQDGDILGTNNDALATGLLKLWRLLRLGFFNIYVEYILH